MTTISAVPMHACDVVGLAQRTGLDLGCLGARARRVLREAF
jgi:hypothetical protein